MIIDPVPAARFVAERFGWAPPTSMVLAGEGQMGRIWRLDSETGPYAVKELYWADDLTAEEAAVTRQVSFCEKARAAGVAAPANLRTESGRYVIALPEELGGRLIRAYEWIDGRPITPSDSAEAVAWAGRTQAIIEGLGVSPGDQEMDPWFYRAPSTEDWTALADRCEAAGQSWAGQLRSTIPQFVAMAEWVRPIDPDDLIVTHTDFQPQNVLVDHAGRFVLLDWDDAGPLTPSRALGQLINWHIHRTIVDHQGIRQTLRGYRDAGGTAKISEVADLCDFCGYLNYLYEQAGLSLERTQPPGLSIDANRRTPDLLDNPPQLTTLEEAVQTAAVL